MKKFKHNMKKNIGIKYDTVIAIIGSMVYVLIIFGATYLYTVGCK